MRIAIGIATTGRPATLTETLMEVARQTRTPDRVVICAVHERDVDRASIASLPLGVDVMFAAGGLPAQRNRILEACSCFDAVVFFDDDFFPAPRYVESAVALLERDSGIAIATGVVLMDGIGGPGLSPEAARQCLREDAATEHGNAVWAEYGAYGCNMVLRLQPARENGVRFDEALPLYAWQEDIDFSRQLARFGRVVRVERLRGVHLGVKRGRTSGFKMGYSQVANPIFLIRKGTMSVDFGLPLILRNMLANIARSFWPEGHIDRRGRLRGNALAVFDLVRGRLHPQRILEID